VPSPASAREWLPPAAIFTMPVSGTNWPS